MFVRRALFAVDSRIPTLVLWDRHSSMSLFQRTSTYVDLTVHLYLIIIITGRFLNHFWVCSQRNVKQNSWRLDFFTSFFKQVSLKLMSLKFLFLDTKPCSYFTSFRVENQCPVAMFCVRFSSINDNAMCNSFAVIDVSYVWLA